jgi:hypothetical protein
VIVTLEGVEEREYLVCCCLPSGQDAAVQKRPQLALDEAWNRTLALPLPGQIGFELNYVVADPQVRILMLLSSIVNLCLTGPILVGLATMAKFVLASSTAFGIWFSSDSRDCQSPCLTLRRACR